MIYLANDKRQHHSYYAWTLIGTRIEWCHFQWPCNSIRSRITILFNVEYPVTRKRCKYDDRPIVSRMIYWRPACQSFVFCYTVYRSAPFSMTLWLISRSQSYHRCPPRNLLCAQLTHDLFVRAKFIVFYSRTICLELSSVYLHTLPTASSTLWLFLFRLETH